MNVDAANQIADGTGIKVGLIYDGIDPNNPDLIRKDGQHVITDYQSFSGEDPGGPTSGLAMYFAGLIAAQGNEVYDLSKYVNKAHPLPAGCTIKIEGIAPGASLAELNPFGNDQAVFNSEIVQAIQYAVTVDHVNVLVAPFGGAPVPNTENDPAALADQAAIAAGVVVVSVTGDNGPSGTNIESPGGVPGVIGVGATTSFQVYRQTDLNGPTLGTSGWESDNISADSTTGVNEYGPRTMAVVAPGDSLWGLCGTDTKDSSPAPIPTTGPRRGSRTRSPPRIRHPRSPRWPRWSCRPTPRRTTAHCRRLPWSSKSSSARPPTWARRPTTRAPGWSTRSRPCSSPSPSTAPARRAARYW